MKTVIVTGAGAGIGYAVVKSCIGNGLTVIACDHDESLLNKLKEQFDDQIKPYKVDVSSYDDVESFFNSLHTNDWPHYLVNNAGIYLARNIFDYTPQHIQQLFSVNLFGAMYFTQFFAKKLMDEKQPSVIVNLSSVAQYGGSDAVYGASKGALAAFTRCCAINFSPHIRVNAVAPGIVETAMFSDLPPEVLKWYRKSELVNQPIQADDVAKTVSFLLSDDAAHYTGATFDLNNGFHRR